LPDLIHLLPDNIANQIAAGEVIQRPASAVKELLENAVDAGASDIRLIVNDAGKSLIQVIDNGKGMSATDARMCFERHATSKIENIEDLFRIRTMGFRGEALASVAAVAQVDLKTRRAEDELGTHIEIENSEVVYQGPVAASVGTNLAMKNLFFNVPARRNFLKSNAAEMRHIIDEFIRVSLSFPQLFFSLTNNQQELFHLEPGSLKQRIVQVLGSNYNARLVAVNEKTDYLDIRGFVGKPEAAKKTRGDQYFFVNNRFIRSAYLNHAVMSAFQEMISSDSFPMYALFIDLDPSQVDVNVHPTKQEIKFEDEKIVYAFVQAAVKHALAQFSITPTIDFELDPNIQKLDAVSQPFTREKQSETLSSPLYRTFTQQFQAHKIDSGSNLKEWQSLFEEAKPASSTGTDETYFEAAQRLPGLGRKWSILEQAPILQIHQTYIIVATTNGYILVDQQAAHERILYERFVAYSQNWPAVTQKNLFPVSLQLNSADAALLQDLLPDLAQLGYEIELFGTDSFIIRGGPADIEQGNEKAVLEKTLEQFKHFNTELRLSKREKLFRSLASQQAIRKGMTLGTEEMKTLLSDLFNSTQPNVAPNGDPVYIEFKMDYLHKLFQR